MRAPTRRDSALETCCVRAGCDPQSPSGRTRARCRSVCSAESCVRAEKRSITVPSDFRQDPSCWTRPSSVASSSGVGLRTIDDEHPPWIESSSRRCQCRSLRGHVRQVHQPVQREDDQPERPTGRALGLGHRALGERHALQEVAGMHLHLQRRARPVQHRSRAIDPGDSMASGCQRRKHPACTAPQLQDRVADDLGQPQVEFDVIAKPGVLEVVQLRQARRTGLRNRRLTTASSCPLRRSVVAR